jgi:diguanylate cyclase (GGDEF)-like protein
VVSPEAEAQLAELAPSGVKLVSAAAGGRPVSPEARALVDAAVAIVELVVSLAEAHALIGALDELTTADPLTGLRNRRFLDRTLAYELVRRRRYERPLTLMLLDLDHFKRVNDTRGHDVGDDVLRAVGDTLRQILRRADLAARYGGEEFAVVFPETPAEGAVVVAERVRRTVQGLDVQGLTITTSIGLASVEGVWEGDPAALLRAADQALYRAKREGRNRVVAVNLLEGSADSSPTITGPARLTSG